MKNNRKAWCVVKALVVALALACNTCAALEDARTVVVPADDKPFVVEQNDYVRLTGKGIAGSRIEIKVDGPAKLELTSNVRELHNGQALIGSNVKDFDLKPSGPGKVTATITVTPPQPEAKAKVSKYEFEVK